MLAFLPLRRRKSAIINSPNELLLLFDYYNLPCAHLHGAVNTSQKTAAKVRHFFEIYKLLVMFFLFFLADLCTNLSVVVEFVRL